jgi:outer membrane protein OmpA-like peptidoglycan-associated protein
VVDYLIKKGISSSRLTAQGYGESELVNECDDSVKCSEVEHQQNRRTEFKILAVKEYLGAR